MPGQWQEEQDHYLLTPLYHIFDQLNEVICQRVLKEEVYATPYIDPSEHTINMGGTDYQSVVTETERVSTYTGLDDYHTLFAARHGRGALDPVPNVGEQKSATTSEIPIPIAGPELINPMERMMPINSDQKEAVKL